MSVAKQTSKVLLATLLGAFALGCEEPPKEESAPPKATASVAVKAPTAAPKPKPPPKPREDCPEGSSGIGTFDKPCEGSGDARMMEVEWTGKTEEKGPKFAVTNKSDKPILHGTVVAYFYDKKGKQLEVTGKDKPRPKQTCSGNIFAGQVKPGEKIYVFFSCVKKSHIPEGTDAIEAEVKTVGFADETGQKNEFYWKNEDLVPDERPKGGLKKAKGKKK